MARRNRRSRHAPREAVAKRVPPVNPPRDRPPLTVLEELKLLRQNTRDLTASIDRVRVQADQAKRTAGKVGMHLDCSADSIIRLHDEARNQVQEAVTRLVDSIMWSARTAIEQSNLSVEALKKQDQTLDDVHLLCARVVEQSLCLEVRAADLEQRLQDKPAV